MSIFSNIMQRIFHHSANPPADVQTLSSAPSASSTAVAPAASVGPAVDVGAVLKGMAATKGGGGNYASSIVDLLKLLDLDSSLTSRKELATELGVNAGEAGSAEQNIALHKAVMDKLAQNGGVVPDSLRH